MKTRSSFPTLSLSRKGSDPLFSSPFPVSRFLWLSVIREFFRR
jgi:hypothetical protein